MEEYIEQARKPDRGLYYGELLIVRGVALSPWILFILLLFFDLVIHLKLLGIFAISPV